MHVGKILKEYIKLQGTPMSEIADILGVSREHVYKILAKEDVGTDVLKKIAEYYNVTFLDILNPGFKEVEHNKISESTEIELLKQIIKSKDETMEAYKTISLLQKT